MAGGFFAVVAFRADEDVFRGVFFDSAASCFSSFATRFSSSSRPRSFFCISSSRAFVSFAASTSLDPPGTSCEPVQRLGSEVLEPGEDVLLFCLRHGAIVPPRVATTVFSIVVDV